MTKKLVIVGGGYLGAQLAQTLEHDLDVTLIEQRDAFVHVPAMIRTIVKPSMLDTVLLPYEQLLTKGTFVKAKVTKVEEQSVTLEDGTKISADYIVIATGSTNSAFLKPAGTSIDDFRTVVVNLHNKLESAQSVVIVGAGTVGSEMAGEISSAMPEKDITLISSDSTLFSQLPKKFATSIMSKLKNANIDIKFGVQVTNLESTSNAYSGALHLSDGTSIEADLIIPAVGSRAVSSLVCELPNSAKRKNGQVDVDAYLRPSAYPNVFCAGDVANCGDAMTIVAVSRQIPWLTKTFKALAAGKQLEQLKPYSPWKKAPLFLPLGPSKGNSYLVVGTFGDWVTRKIKGENLFIDKYRKLFRLNP
ncbi:NAD(P)/FAD-dependent oxidoreductase [Paraglaciecola sp. 2405UD69-4]|uniref:NAD(P)/FAD-dependent oxidoreductase n=1 Tax=Paraglaciecola sp. 2405UD69-4 TaxID=3391836 RepID=UPI0039C8C47E